jgi:hypothetical protein
MTNLCWKGYGECDEITCVIRADICEPISEWIAIRKQEESFRLFWQFISSEIEGAKKC